MPLYLCQPGADKPEPWRHGLSVYSAPFAVDDTSDDEDLDLKPRPLRRLRHGEIVLVDDVCLAWERYWLRLRWPGNRGGFAGYLPVDKSDSDEKKSDNQEEGEFLCFESAVLVSHRFLIHFSY